MTPALGLTVYHPDQADHGYTLFALMTGTSACLIDMQGDEGVEEQPSLLFQPHTEWTQGIAVIKDDLHEEQ